MKVVRSFLCSNTCCGILGTILLSSGIILLCLWTWFFDQIVSSMLVLKPDSYTSSVWQDPPISLSLDFYFFHWLNPEDINDAAIKPQFRQVGPYRFTEIRKKINLTWNDNNNTITYKQWRSWKFDRKNSVGELSDRITTLNVVTASAASNIRDWSYFMRRGFSMSLAALAPHVNLTKTVGELLFDGYDDPIVDLSLNFPFLSGDAPPFDKFGWFYKRNNSDEFDGVFNMATGVDGNNGELLNWNYRNETDYFQDWCGKVHGSAAELYPQKQTRDHIGFFSPDMCRYVRLDYESDVSFHGITGYKFSAQHGMLDNGTILEENRCFCNGECVPSGVLNVSSCRYGTPAFVSLPNFYGADPMYLSLLEGLRPDKKTHELYITLEPTTGIPLDVAIRLQLNIRIQPVETITAYEKVPDMWFPVLWFEQRASIPENMVWMFILLVNASVIIPIFSIVLITSGCAILIFLGCRKIFDAIFNQRLCREEMPLNSQNKTVRFAKKHRRC